MDRRDFLRRMAAIGLVAASALPARAQLTTLGAGPGGAAGGGGGGGANTWGPATLGPGMALSGGDLTATHSGTTNGCCIGTASRSSGTPSFDVIFDNGTSVGMGMCDGSFVGSDSLGNTLHGFAITPANGDVFINGSNVGNCGQTGVPGSTWRIQYNAAGGTIQVGVNGGSLGSAVSIAAMSPGALFPCCAADTNGTTFVLNPTLWV